MDEMVDTMVALRKGKMSAEDCRAALGKGNYFGTMLVKMGVADALLGGATYSTADTVRPALQIVKPKPGSHLVSSCFLMVRGDEMLAMGDCALNIEYTDDVDKDGNVTLSGSDKLAEVGMNAPERPGCSVLSPRLLFSAIPPRAPERPGGRSGAHRLRKGKALAPEFEIDGEMQFDAAVSPVVGQLKFPGSKVAGYANTFIFPEIQSGNIGCKIAQRLGGCAGSGPVLQGLNAPINDLSRGCNADEVYQMSIITAAFA
jgi:phosphate acetyltransferase